MRSVHSFKEIYLYRGKVDFRKSIDGLAALVQAEMGLDIFQPALFVFVSRTRDRIKALCWDRTGFALWFKRLEKDSFPWPKGWEQEVLRISPQELEWLLEGFDIFSIKPHESLTFSALT